MLALCLMLLITYYTLNHAGIIGRSLSPSRGNLQACLGLILPNQYSHLGKSRLVFFLFRGPAVPI